jgi:hypothetical protein
VQFDHHAFAVFNFVLHFLELHIPHNAAVAVLYGYSLVTVGDLDRPYRLCFGRRFLRMENVIFYIVVFFTIGMKLG